MDEGQPMIPMRQRRSQDKAPSVRSIEALEEDKNQRSKLDITHNTEVSDTRLTLTILLLLAVIVFQLIVLFKAIWLTPGGPLSNALRTVYTTGITLLATIISSVVAGTLRRMWLNKIQKHGRQLDRTQVLLVIGELKAQFREWDISLVLIIVGLITTCLTGSTAISLGEKTFIDASNWFAIDQVHDQIDSSSPYADYEYGNCWIVSNDTYISQANNTLLAFTGVNNISGQFYLYSAVDEASSNSLMDDFYNENPQLCHLHHIARMMQWEYGLPKVHYPPTPDRSACFDTLDGVVSCSALGAPIGLSSDCSLYSSLGCLAGIQNTACVPIFTKNPISCKFVDNVSYTKDDNGTIKSATSDTCTPTTTFSSQKAALVYGFCPQPDFTMSVLMSLLDDSRFNQAIQNLLLGSSQHDVQSAPVTIDCQISLNSTMQFQTVTNSTLSEGPGSWNEQLFLGKTPTLISTGVSCTGPLDIENIVTPAVQMGAAAMLWELLNWDGFVDTMFLANVKTNSTATAKLPMAFASSSNRLEDLIGTLVASAVGFALGGDLVHGYTVQDRWQNVVTYTAATDRIGTGHISAILYCLPLLAIIAALLWLRFAKTKG